MTITEVTKENLVDDHMHRQIPAPEIVLLQKLFATKTNHHYLRPYIQHRGVACYKEEKKLYGKRRGAKIQMFSFSYFFNLDFESFGTNMS